MKITAAQYPGLIQNIATLGQVDLSDNDLELLRNLAAILEQAIRNVDGAIMAQQRGAAEEQPE